MKTIRFTKMVAAGNDFAVIDERAAAQTQRYTALARAICGRKYGAGADGLLVIGSSRKADVRMRIFNADGSEAPMCGNGARCAALYEGGRRKAEGGRKIIALETRAGIIQSVVGKDNVKVRLTDPRGLKLDMPISVNGRKLKVNFVDTGVPHVVILVEGLDSIDAAGLGRDIRYHGAFAPRGANVNFVEVRERSLIAVRTYERGVEDETLACGTGSTASALIFGSKAGASSPVSVLTKGGEILSVYFERRGGSFENVWLEGMPRIVYKGVYHV